MDLPDHGLLGDRRGADGLREDAVAVLRGAVPAGPGRGRVLPGGDRLPDPLVPRPRPRQALSWFFIATPVAQFVSPKLSYFLLRIGTTETIGGVTIQHPAIWGMQGWQWMYIAWGIPAVILGILVLYCCPTGPGTRLARSRRARRPGAGAEPREEAAQAGARAT